MGNTQSKAQPRAMALLVLILAPTAILATPFPVSVSVSDVRCFNRGRDCYSRSSACYQAWDSDMQSWQDTSGDPPQIYDYCSEADQVNQDGSQKYTPTPTTPITTVGPTLAPRGKNPCHESWAAYNEAWLRSCVHREESPYCSSHPPPIVLASACDTPWKLPIDVPNTIPETAQYHGADVVYTNAETTITCLADIWCTAASTLHGLIYHHEGTGAAYYTNKNADKQGQEYNSRKEAAERKEMASKASEALSKANALGGGGPGSYLGTRKRQLIEPVGMMPASVDASASATALPTATVSAAPAAGSEGEDAVATAAPTAAPSATPAVGSEVEGKDPIASPAASSDVEGEDVPVAFMECRDMFMQALSTWFTEYEWMEELYGFMPERPKLANYCRDLQADAVIGQEAASLSCSEEVAVPSY